MATTATIAQNLKFNADGKFKIAQFTDIHYNGSKASKAALKVLENVLTQECPDLIVLSGDIIYGTPAKKNLLDVSTASASITYPLSTSLATTTASRASQTASYTTLRVA